MSPQIEPELSLALSLCNNPGVYVPLLGSGVSRSAGILTGWEITLGLAEQLSQMMGEDCEGAPDQWYVKKFGKAPDYSEVLEALCKTPSERQGLLRKYFEPTAEEKADGMKVPQRAHRSIASLVKDGLVRVIVTTNFDRLMERACEDEGIVPSVIYNADTLKGAKPFHQNPCTIVKVHGDYLDTRIKNSPAELTEYEKEMNGFLDRLFDEHGLIICGWSGQWDGALRNAILRAPGRRYQSYWVKRGAIAEEAQPLIRNLGVVEIAAADADTFFHGLREKAESLLASNRPHPTSVKTAVATLKRILPDERNEIQVDDLVQAETDRLFEQFGRKDPEKLQKLVDRMALYEQQTEILRALIMTGVRWGKPIHLPTWLRAIDRFGHPARWYGALLMLYGPGLVACATKRYGVLAKILKDANYEDLRETGPLIHKVYASAGSDQFNREKGGNTVFHTPISDRLLNFFKEDLLPLVVTEDRYKKVFWQYEYLSGLAHACYVYKSGGGLTAEAWGPPGRFTWETRNKPNFDKEILKDDAQEVAPRFVEAGIVKDKVEFDKVVVLYNDLQSKISGRWY